MGFGSYTYTNSCLINKKYNNEEIFCFFVCPYIFFSKGGE